MKAAPALALYDVPQKTTIARHWNNKTISMG
jgi:hypothetical protein